MRAKRMSVWAAGLAAGVAACGVLVAMGPDGAPGTAAGNGGAASAAGAAQATSPLAELGFLAGTWRGDMGPSMAEEVWSAPIGTSIMGCFRWLKPDQSPSMFEMLTITREGERTLLRLRHYSPTLTAKEEKDKPLTLTLSESGPGKAVFAAEKDGAGDLTSVRYELRDGALHIDVEFVQGEKPRQPLKFRLARLRC